MKNAILKTMAAVSAVVAMAAPELAHANCQDRRVGGTLIGAVAGGLLGNAVAHGGGRPVGTLLGAGAGAYAGHEIAGAGCHGYYRHSYYRYHHRHRYYYDR